MMITTKALRSKATKRNRFLYRYFCHSVRNQLDDAILHSQTQVEFEQQVREYCEYFALSPSMARAVLAYAQSLDYSLIPF